MVMDFGELKEIVRPFIEGWDHALLVQKGALSAAQIKSLHSFNRKLHVLLWNPTAECMAYTIATGCKWPKRIVEVEVKVWETDSSFASYRSEDDLRCAVGLEPLAKGSHP
jgi:6-pyruvoyl-tetrahydropterin synthase